MFGTKQAAHPPRPVARLVATAALVPALAVIWQSTSLVQQDLIFTAAETEVSFWGRGSYQPTPVTRQGTERALEELLGASQAMPDYLELAASLYAWQGYWATDPAQADSYDQRALQAQYAAQLIRPAYRSGWEALAEQAARLGDEAMGELAGVRLGVLRAGQAAAVLADDEIANTRESNSR